MTTEIDTHISKSLKLDALKLFLLFLAKMLSNLFVMKKVLETLKVQELPFKIETKAH